MKECPICAAPQAGLQYCPEHMQLVICVNHYPHEVLPIGSTREQAEARVRQLDEEHKAGPWKPARWYHYHPVDIHEVKS